MIGVQEGSPKVCSVRYSTWDVSVSHEGSGKMKPVSKYVLLVPLRLEASQKCFLKMFEHAHRNTFSIHSTSLMLAEEASTGLPDVMVRRQC